ncbi:MAG: nicotinate phosphoribosyltransferase [bacterium]
MLKQNTGLYTDYYELTMAQGHFLKQRSDLTATFDYFFRENPFAGGYVIFAGLQDFLSLLENFRFDKESLTYLQNQGFSEKFVAFLSDFKFQGDIYACREGEIVFPGEPTIRVEGNIIEAQLIETMLLNIVNFSSLITTKASRMTQIAGDRKIVDFGLRRAQGTGGILASKATIIGGATATSNAYSAQQFDLPATGTQAHSWVQSYDSELSAFRDFAEIYPQNCVLLVDTYDTLQSGLPNAIQVAKEMEKRGEKLLGIRLDSGDLGQLSKKARQMLDNAGLDYVKIAASGQLDEYKIQKLLADGAPIDLFGVGTRLITGKNDAALNGVYKLSQIGGQPTLKISEDREKIILPGRKNILRYSENKFQKDKIILEKEKKSLDQSKEFLLKKVVDKGQKIIPEKNAAEISEYRNKRLALLPLKYKKITDPDKYQVKISDRLKSLQEKLIAEKAN